MELLGSLAVPDHGEGSHTLLIGVRVRHGRDHLIDDLPDDATIADVQYRLYVIDAVNRGRDEIAAGAGVPHEQVANEMRAKWGRAREK